MARHRSLDSVQSYLRYFGGLMDRFHDDMTLGEARALLRELVVDGHQCPCCTQMAKVYRRKLNSGMARTLITMYRHAGSDFVHTPSLPGDTHEASQLVWWDLIIEERVCRDDGGRAGYWRITSAGLEWLRGQCRIPKYARVYDGRCLGLDGDLISIQQALGNRFSYSELMAEPVEVDGVLALAV